MDGDDEKWRRFSPGIKKWVQDSNAVALEKGLQAALAYVENCDAAGKQASQVTGYCNSHTFLNSELVLSMVRFDSLRFEERRTGSIWFNKTHITQLTVITIR